jgi:hypothetical protein
MTAQLYGLIFTVVPLLYGIIAVLAMRRWGRAGVLSVWIVSAVMIGALGIWDWRTPPDEGTPLAFYACIAIIPTAAGAWVAAWSGRGRMHTVMQMVLSGIVTWISILPVLLIFTLLSPVN